MKAAENELLIMGFDNCQEMQGTAICREPSYKPDNRDPDVDSVRKNRLGETSFLIALPAG